MVLNAPIIQNILKPHFCGEKFGFLVIFANFLLKKIETQAELHARGCRRWWRDGESEIHPQSIRNFHLQGQFGKVQTNEYKLSGYTQKHHHLNLY